jgi:type I restriction enzyme, S subunit
MSSSDWSRRRLLDFVSRLDAGVSVNADDRPRRSGEVGVLKTGALSGGIFRPDKNKTVWAKERRRVAIPVEGDSIIVSRMNTPDLVGESAYVADDWSDLFLPDRLWLLRVRDRNAVCVRWLSHVLSSPQARAYLKLHATGTSGSMKNLSKARLLELPVPSPPVDQQRCIATILNTLDDAIRQTEAVIAKLRLIRQGLLDDLLTRGVDEAGVLRPVADEAPRLYKESRLGRVPVEWSVESIRSVSRGPGCYGSGAASRDYDPSLPRYVRITDITDDGRLSGATKASIRTLDADPYMLSDGDLLFARSGATVGKTYLYRPSDGPCAHAGYVIKYAIDTARAIPTYVFMWTQSPAFWRWIGQTLRQGAQPNINEKEYGGHLLALPPLAEQRRIVGVLEAVTSRLEVERQEAEALRALQSGLVDDLLTGRVRVKVPEEAAQ